MPSRPPSGPRARFLQRFGAALTIWRRGRQIPGNARNTLGSFEEWDAGLSDPLLGRSQGILERCLATSTCPKIVHAATALELWELRQSLGFTDPLGLKDLDEPANVRSYIMASTQHAQAQLPLPAKEPFLACQQQPNPNPHNWTMRALLTHLTAWVKDGTEPPPSSRPTIAAGNLVAPDQVHFPRIPANGYGGVTRPAVKFVADNDPLHVQDYGNAYNAADASGIISGDPPKLSTGRYGNLVAQVDADGNDLGGIRDVFVAVPIGTYTGWNLFNKNFFEDGFCTLSGSFIPFAPTRQERFATGDLRPRLKNGIRRKKLYALQPSRMQQRSCCPTLPLGRRCGPAGLRSGG